MQWSNQVLATQNEGCVLALKEQNLKQLNKQPRRKQRGISE
ncbi:hypothetical protein [Xenorhabdus eapokensis]|nr:hypothetical protein [Xenorhabdus eapokensis]